MGLRLEMYKEINLVKLGKADLTLVVVADVEVDIIDSSSFNEGRWESDIEVEVEWAETTIQLHASGELVIDHDTTELKEFHALFHEQEVWDKAVNAYASRSI